MIAAFCLLFLVAGTLAQRSPYLSSSNQEYPGLLNRFKPSSSAAANGTGIGDRIGGSTAAPSPSSQGGAEGTLYDKETLDRVASWPVDKQPFWFKNRKQIAQHTGASVSQQNATAQK